MPGVFKEIDKMKQLIAIIISATAVMILAAPCFASEDFNNAVRIERQYCERTALVVYKPVEVIREVEVIKEKVVCLDELRYFTTASELYSWVQKWDYEPGFELNDPDNDCDDRSFVSYFSMMQSMIRDGYFAGMAFHPNHVAVVTVVGNSYYFVEPFSREVTRLFDNQYWRID